MGVPSLETVKTRFGSLDIFIEESGFIFRVPVNPMYQFKGKTLVERVGKEKAEAMKKKMKENSFLKGKTRIFSKETKEKMSKVRKGKKYEEIYGLIRGKKLRQLKKEQIVNGFNDKNKITSDKTRQKMSKAKKGKSVEEIWGEERGKQIREKWSKRLKNKTYEELYGKEKAEELKLRHSVTMKQGIKDERIVIICPKQDTTIEIKIQKYLEILGIEYFTHKYMKEIEHSYRCDILIPSLNLVIETDGDHWHKYPIGNDMDHIRTKELIEKGFKVLRLWEFEIRKMTIEQFNKKLNEVSK